MFFRAPFNSLILIKIESIERINWQGFAFHKKTSVFEAIYSFHVNITFNFRTATCYSSMQLDISFPVSCFLLLIISKISISLVRFKVWTSVNQIYWTFMAISISSWWFPYLHGDLHIFMVISISSRRIPYLHGDFHIFMVIPISSWRFPYLHGDFHIFRAISLSLWWFPYLHGDFHIFMAISISSYLLNVRTIKVQISQFLIFVFWRLFSFWGVFHFGTVKNMMS